MITLYRFLSYENETLISFQGSDEDAQAISEILAFQVPRSTNKKLYEQGYFCYIRGPDRVKREEKVINYLRANYVDPSIELLLFRGINPCPDDRPVSYWPAVLAGQVQHFFAQKHQRLVGTSGLGYEVFLAEPVEPAPGLHLYSGISYRVNLQSDFIPIIQTDIAFRYLLDGETISRTKVFQRFSGQGDTLSTIHEYETQTTDAIFDLGQRFISSLASIGDTFQFNEQPVTPNELGWQTWLWAHEYPLTLEVSDGQQIKLATDMLNSDLGLYQPPDLFQIIIIYPEDDPKQIVPDLNGSDFVKQTRKIIREALPGHKVPINYAGYMLGAANEVTVEQCGQLNEQHPDRKTLYLMITPPRPDPLVDDPEYAALEKESFNLMKEVRRLGRKDYLVTLNWDNLLDDYDRTFIIESAVLKGLVVLGAIPWRVRNIPFANGKGADDVCFIGLDVKTDRRPAIVGGAIIDGYGVLQGYLAAQLSKPEGDLIDEIALSHIVEELFKYFYEATGRDPDHVIVHRDGLFHGKETEHLQYFFGERGTTYDLVEVRKSGAPRLRQKENLYGTPSKDIAVGSESEGVAYLSNTLSVGQFIGGERIFPATDSVSVHRKVGSSEMRILAAQVHALSRAHISAIRRTERLPVTTAYADALVSNVGFRSQKGSHFGKAIGEGAQPYWL